MSVTTVDPRQPKVTIEKSACDYFENLANNTDDTIFLLQLVPGGCAGFEYQWKSTDKYMFSESDYVYFGNSFTLVVRDYWDRLEALRGITIRYLNSISESRLDIINPNAVASCGCNTSIAI